MNLTAPETRRKFRKVAQDLIDRARSGKKVDPHALEWAHNILRCMPEPDCVKAEEVMA